MSIDEERMKDIGERLEQATIEAERAETRQTYAEALRKQLEAARAWMEHLRVQTALADKEARSEMNDLVERAEGAYHAARHQLARVEEDTAETLEALRAGARRVIEDLEAAVETAWNRFRSARTG